MADDFNLNKEDENVFEEQSPSPQDGLHDDNDETTEDTEQEDSSKSRRRQKKAKRVKANLPVVDAKAVDDIISINSALEELSDDEVNLVRLLTETPAVTTRAGFIARLLDYTNRAIGLKALATERDILTNLDNPFKAGVFISGLAPEERRLHWKLLASINPQRAKEISGDDSGEFVRSRSDIKEASQLFDMYMAVKEEYGSRLDSAEAVLRIVSGAK